MHELRKALQDASVFMFYLFLQVHWSNIDPIYFCAVVSDVCWSKANFEQDKLLSANLHHRITRLYNLQPKIPERTIDHFLVPTHC